MKRILRSLVLVSIIALSLSTLVFAQSIPKPDFLPGTENVAESAAETQEYYLNTTIPRAINIAIGLMGLATFAGMIIASINMLTAYGNEDKINRAKTNLRYGILGFMIVMLSYAIVSIIVSISIPSQGNGDPDPTPETWIPSAHAALNPDTDTSILLPSQFDVIERHDDEGRVSLPSGDILTEIVPAIVVNVFYMIGFLVFIAFMSAGIMLVIGRGNEDFQSKAKNIIIWSSIALGFMALGYALMVSIATLNLDQNDGSTSDDVFVETVAE
jgi:hypothetical protein